MSDVTLNDLPESWEWTKLGDVITKIIGGGTPSKNNKKYWEGEIPWLTIKDMRSRRPADTMDHITQDAVDGSATNLIPADTVIMATRVGLGKVVRVPYDTTINQDLKALITPPELDKAYLEYWLVSRAQFLESIGSGTTVKGIRLEQIRELDFPIAPLEQQKRIVAKIEELFSHIDAGIAALNKAKQLLKQYRQSVLKAAVTGELTKEWREDNQEIDMNSVCDELTTQRLNTYADACLNAKKEKCKKPRRPSNIDEKIEAHPDAKDYVLDLPNGWGSRPLSYVSDNYADSIVDGPFGASINVKKDYLEEGVPVIRMVNIRPFKFVRENRKFITEKKFSGLERHKIKSGDVLFAKVGATIGDCCIYPEGEPEAMLSTTGSCRITVDPKVYNSEFLVVVLNAYRNIFRNITSQVAQPFLNMKTIKSVPLPIPSISEQVEIVAKVNEKFESISRLEAELNIQLVKAEKNKQSVLASAFSGKIIGV